jgi:hypothetical protein
MSKIKEFLTKANSFSREELVLEYTQVCDGLMFEDEEVVREATKLMTDNIRIYARKKSDLYRGMEKIGIIDKTMLDDKNKWYVPGIKSRKMQTSGTMNGSYFEYVYWDQIFTKVEKNLHYLSVLKEFGVENYPKVLCLLEEHRLHSNANRDLVVLKNTKSPMHSHGADNAETHSVDMVPLFTKDPLEHFKRLINHCISKKIDVILTTGPFINSLRYYATKLGIKERMCKLLSSTCDPLMTDDAIKLKEDGVIENWCDHMRCWDGGASFFTCKHGRHHLMDNLSWCVEDDGRLISTDYFSLAAPFVNYWNGDYVHIGSDYNRCGCGRLYREFNMSVVRDFSVFGMTSGQIKDKIRLARVNGIKYVKCFSRGMEITTKKDITWEEKQRIIKSIPEIKNVMFRAETALPCGCKKKKVE